MAAWTWSLVLAGGALAAVGAAGAVAPPPTPPGVELAPVGPALRIDGVLHQAHAYRSVLPPQELAAAFVRLWRVGAKHGLVTDVEAGGWRVLGRRVGTRHETVQLRPDGHGTSGYVAARELGTPAARVPSAPFAWPGGTRVLRTIATDDRDARATQIVALVPYSPRAVGAALAANVRRAGWHGDDPATIAGPAGPTTPELADRPRRWTRDREELWFVVVPHEHAAAVVAHHVLTARPGGRP